MAYTLPAPEFANIVIRTCSFTLNGPGFSLNSHRVPLRNTRFVIVAAINCPSGTTAICAEMAVMARGSRRYQKNWFRNDSTTQERLPSTHIRNVRTGREGSSVVATVIATCFIGEFSSSSSTSSSSSSFSPSPFLCLFLFLILFVLLPPSSSTLWDTTTHWTHHVNWWN